MSKTRVLFMCTGNTARSQMAEAFLRAYGSDRFEAYSAGLEPHEINPLTRVVMAGRGLDLDGQHAKGLKEFLGKVHFGYLITVCSRAETECPTFPAWASASSGRSRIRPPSRGPRRSGWPSSARSGTQSRRASASGSTNTPPRPEAHDRAASLFPRPTVLLTLFASHSQSTTR